MYNDDQLLFTTAIHPLDIYMVYLLPLKDSSLCAHELNITANIILTNIIYNIGSDTSSTE